MPMKATDESYTGGFTGTIPEFLRWIQGWLAYGSVHISEPVASSRSWKGPVRRVEMVTAGYSDDEDLLGLVHLGRGNALSLFSLRFWESRGGRYVYEIPAEDFDSESETVWLQPASAVFETVARARKVVIGMPQHDELVIEAPNGVELAFAEPERDINDPSGVLTIQPYHPPATEQNR